MNNKAIVKHREFMGFECGPLLGPVNILAHNREISIATTSRSLETPRHNAHYHTHLWLNKVFATYNPTADSREFRPVGGALASRRRRHSAAASRATPPNPAPFSCQGIDNECAEILGQSRKQARPTSGAGTGFGRGYGIGGAR